MPPNQALQPTSLPSLRGLRTAAELGRWPHTRFTTDINLQKEIAPWPST